MMVRIAAVLVFVVVATGVAGARQGDPRLEPLFARLQQTTDAREAAATEEQIWALWMASGDPETDDLMSRGVAALRIGSFITAVGYFNTAILRDPDLAEAWNKRATALYLLDEYMGALRDVTRTLALEPRHFGALAGLGLVYSALGEPEPALAAFERALAINPHMPAVAARAAQLRKELEENRI